MTPGRSALAHVLVAAVLAGSLYDIVTSQEHWPFSDYPMFSTVHRKHVLDNWYRVYGVTRNGPGVAILAYAELWPLDQSRLPPTRPRSRVLVAEVGRVSEARQ